MPPPDLILHAITPMDGIFKGWNCIMNNKSNSGEIIKWRWKPRECSRRWIRSSFSTLSEKNQHRHFPHLSRLSRAWWAPSKFNPIKSPMLFFEKGMPVIPLIPPDVGLDKAPIMPFSSA
ncbi:hypothetical protein V6N11_083338 [Hibiscus sabdariffa]|uniref:Uncharacterized protein n=1 Tax=Hibiscus sabdariffa TaxID=183260 RepID=A0ABR2QLK6_9ROSI